ncbi:MAG: Hsp70 family protein, partial [Candidatus Dormibacteria bacterium]
IEVSFDIDTNGMLHVSAKDKASNKEQSIRITASSGLSKEEVEKMKRDAESHAADDKKKKEDIEIKNHGDTVLFQAKKFVAEYTDRIPGDIKAKLDSAIEDLDASIKANDMSALIKDKTETVNKLMSDAGQAMYQQSAANDQNADEKQHANEDKSADADNKSNDEKEVHDADYEVVS